MAVVALVVLTGWATTESPTQRATWSPGSSPNGSSAGLGSPIPPGTFVTLSCPDGWLNITQGASISCHDTSASPAYDLCPSLQCNFTVVGTPDPGDNFTGWGTAGLAGVTSATTTRTSLYVFTPNPANHYVGSVTLCTSKQSHCGIAGGPCTAAVLGQPTQSDTYGYQQAWVNWSFAGSAPVTQGFSWWIVRGQDLPEPSISVVGSTASINLNGLASGTTYHYESGVSNSCGSDTLSGTFTTPGAPLTADVGWVYQQALQPWSPYFEEPVGSDIQGAWVNLTANCDSGGPSTPVSFEAATTNGTGYYSLTFPAKFVSVHGLEVTNGFFWPTNGTCFVQVRPAGGGNSATYNYHEPDSNYTLVASWRGDSATYTPGDYNVTTTVPVGTNSVNDYHAFALPANHVEPVPVGLAFIHTDIGGTQYYNAGCGIDMATSSGTATVVQHVDSFSSNFFGETGSISTQESSIGQQFSQPLSWGNTTALDVSYYFSGFVNQDATAENSFIVSGIDGASGVPVTDQDWDATMPAPVPSLVPTNARVIVAYPSDTISNGGIAETVFAGGSYSSSSTDQVSYSVPFSWAGVSAKVAFQNGWTVTANQNFTESCHFAYTKDPSGGGGDPYFYVVPNSGAYGSTAIVHVWLEGWCGGTNEYACP